MLMTGIALHWGAMRRCLFVSAWLVLAILITTQDVAAQGERPDYPTFDGSRNNYKFHSYG